MGILIDKESEDNEGDNEKVTYQSELTVDKLLRQTEDTVQYQE